MRTIGIISEYNPFHSGHRYQVQTLRRTFGADCGIVCVMSGNWVQRGDAAVADKWTRAALALAGGVNLVLELPTLWAASSAETFALGGVSLLEHTGMVEILSFGSEAGTLSPLAAAAACLTSPDYPAALRVGLDRGLPLARARQEAVSALLGADGACLRFPNNNLAVSYLCALHRLSGRMRPHTLRRAGAGHDASRPTGEGPVSASYLRTALLAGDRGALLPHLSPADADTLLALGPSALSFCTRGVLARLRTMTEDQYAALPDSGEGLDRRLQAAAGQACSLDDLYARTKSKRYALSRIRRMVLWAFLGLTEGERPAQPPYLRVLGFDPVGRTLLRQMKETAALPVLVKPAHVSRLDPEAQRVFRLEARCTALYELCRRDFGMGVSLNEYTHGPVIR